MTPNFEKFTVQTVEGEKEVSIQTPLPYSVFKGVRRLFADQPDKAILILNNSVVKKEDQHVISGIIESDSTPLILQLEDLFARLCAEVNNEFKKK